MKRIKQYSGFTVIELVVTLAMAAILFAIGIPSFQWIVQNNRASTQANDLMTALMYARSEAVTRATDIGICPANAAQTDCSGDNDWTNGWIVFLDPGDNQDFDSGTDTILRVWEAPSGEPTIESVQPGTSTAVNGIGFNQNGAASQAVTITSRIDDCAGDLGRDIDISALGRPAVTRVGC